MSRQSMSRTTHPAPGRVYAEFARERAKLARALAIEADWRYHDGPELAMRYRAAAPLSACLSGSVQADDSAVAARVVCPALSRNETTRARRVFRRLIGTYHPRLAIGRAGPERIETWRAIKALYRRGDLEGLCRIQDNLRARGVTEPWPIDPASVRHECVRLRCVRARVDRRLDAMRRRFPFNCRERFLPSTFETPGVDRILAG